MPYALQSLFPKNKQGGAHRQPGQEDLMVVHLDDIRFMAKPIRRRGREITT
jgi:hypothetical protein